MMHIASVLRSLSRRLPVPVFLASTAFGAEAPLHSLTALLEGRHFVSIPAGEFVMGSNAGNPDEAPPHRVRLTRGFELSKYEVTQAQWRAVMDSPHSKAKDREEPEEVDPSHFKGPTRPVEKVSWEAVQGFLGALNTRDPKYNYRLPTEAEWEYAAKAGTGESGSGTEPASWCESTSGGQTHPVGTKAPNEWGLHDMLGNVMEWVQDSYAPDYYANSPGVDPPGSNSSSYKVYRGGAWLSDAKQCRPGFRGFDFPGTGYYSVGLRLVREPK